MKLSDLMLKGTLRAIATATVATPATRGLLAPLTVATVAVAAEEDLGMGEGSKVLGSFGAQPAKPVVSTSLPNTSCANCAHTTPAKTCANPVGAGLSTGHEVFWITQLGEHGARCPAHHARHLSPTPDEALPRLTAAQIREVIGWDDAECERAGRYMTLAQSYEFDIDLAERITDHLMLRDRRGDDLHMCVECRRFRPWRCTSPQVAGRHTAELGRDQAVQLRRCRGIQRWDSPVPAPPALTPKSGG